MQEKLKNAKGITLVALIITIIILLILAGVTIGLVIGENGLIEKSKQSANKYNDASEIERINMIVAEAQTKGYEQGNNGELTQANLQEALDNSYGVGKATASEKQADGSFIIKVGEKEYKKDDSLGVSSLNIVQPKNIADWEYTTDTETNTIIINKYKGKDTEVIVPNYIGDIPVKAIDGTGANFGRWGYKGGLWDRNICEKVSFSSTSVSAQLTIEKIIIPEGIESIGRYTFCDTRNLQEISLPNTLKTIGEYAFGRCEKITNIIIPKEVNTINEGTFFGCSNLTSVRIPECVTSIYDSAFSGCNSLTSVRIPECVTSIYDFVFSECSNLTSIEIPNSVTRMGNMAFYNISSDAQITCDFVSRPSGWNSSWTNCTNIIWKRAQT